MSIDIASSDYFEAHPFFTRKTLELIHEGVFYNGIDKA